MVWWRGYSSGNDAGNNGCCTTMTPARKDLGQRRQLHSSPHLSKIAELLRRQPARSRRGSFGIQNSADTRSSMVSFGAASRVGSPWSGGAFFDVGEQLLRTRQVPVAVEVKNPLAIAAAVRKSSPRAPAPLGEDTKYHRYAGCQTAGARHVGRD